MESHELRRVDVVPEHVPTGRRSFPRSARVSQVFALAWVLSCGGSDAGPTAPNAPAASLTTLTVSLASSTVVAGQTTSASAAGFDQNGVAIATGTVLWSSGAPSLATVTSSGTITALGAGQVTIIATAGGRSGQATLTILPPVTFVSVSPASFSVVLGATQQLSAFARDSSGTPLTGRSIAWGTSDSTKVRVSPTGLVTAVSLGTATVAATSEGKIGFALVTITPVPVASMTVAPSVVALRIGATQQLTVQTLDAAGASLSGRVVTWTSTDESKATVSATGLVTALDAGTATITAASELRSAAASITVTQAPVAGITLAPDAVTLGIGATQQLLPTLRDVDGHLLPGRSVQWSSSAPSIATVSGFGLVTAVSAGTAEIRAVSEGIEAKTPVVVTGVTRGLMMMAGDQQVVRAGAEFPIMLEVALRDDAGQPASNVAVRFQGVGAGSSPDSPGWPPRTNSAGRVRVRWWAPVDGTKHFTVTARIEGVGGFIPDEVLFSLHVSESVLFFGADTVLTLGDSASLRATLDGVRQAGMAWSSSDPSVVAVSPAGIVSARGEGSATITGSLATATQVVRATRVVRVRVPLSSGAAARVFPASSFIAGNVSINLPATTSGSSYIVLVPAYTTLDWKSGLANTAISTQVSVTSSTDATATLGRDLRWGRALTKHAWTSPRIAAQVGLATRRQFSVQTPSQGRVSVTGRLAFTGTDYAFYEDTTNSVNFTDAQYRRMDQLLTSPTSDLFDLMGAPTDLDGNGKIVVFVSRTVLSNAGAGTAFMYGCDMNPGSSDCPTTGELLYFGSPDGFGDWASNPSYYVENWYPRNILHESVHILQFTQAWRGLSQFRNPNAPAHLTEGLAEFTRMRSRMGFTDAWNYAKSQYAARDFSKTPANDVYYTAAMFNWWLGRKFGDGYPQAVISAMFTAHESQQDIFASSLGVEEPELLAMFYASLYFDESAFGSRFGVEFPGENVPSLLGNTPPAVEEMVPGLTLARSLQYTQGRIYKISHAGPINVTVRAGGVGVVVLVAQP